LICAWVGTCGTVIPYKLAETPGGRVGGASAADTISGSKIPAPAINIEIVTIR